MTNNWALIVSYILAVLIQIGLPVTLAILAVKKLKVSGWVIVTGVLTFIGSQVVHLPLLAGINALFTKGILPVPSATVLPWFNAITAGLMAGLCEETARLVGFKILKAKAQPFNSGLALGIGHGGIESGIVGVLVLTSFVGGLTSSSALTAMQFWSTAWHLPLAGGVERITAVSAQILMSVFVWKAVTSRNYWWYVLAVLYHALIDGVSVMLVSAGLSAWGIESALLVFLVIDVVLLWRFWVKERAKEKASLEAEPAAI